MFTDLLHSLLPSLQHLGAWGYWAVLALSLLGSVAFIGELIPCVAVMLLAGFVAAHGHLGLGNLIVFAAAGGVLGDGISYYLGKKSPYFQQHGERILTAVHLEDGRKYFEKHGNKSILFARFISPLRPINSFIAGQSNMRRRNFFAWSMVSACLWTAYYLLIGYLIGTALTILQSWSSKFVAFLIILSAAGFLLWLLIKKTRGFFSYLGLLVDSAADAVRAHPAVAEFARTHPRLTALLKGRFERDHFFGLPFTVISLIFAYAILTSVDIISDGLTSGTIVAFDIRLENLLYFFRDDTFLRIFQWITLLGSVPIIVSIAVVSSVLLWLMRKRVPVLYLWLTLAGSQLLVLLGRRTIHRSRPGEYLPYYQEHTFSFPSSHAALSIALYGFLVYLFWAYGRKRKTKTAALFCGTVLILLIGVSRMYLGLHFLSDVIGGYLIGFVWLFAGIVFTEWNLSRREARQPVRLTRKVALTAAGLIACEILFYAAYVHSFRPPPTDYAPPTVREQVADPLGIFSQFGLSKFSEGIFGGNEEPLSFIIVARNDEALIADMNDAGWYTADRENIRSLGKAAKYLALRQQYLTAPTTPSFWNAKVHDISFEKPTDLSVLYQRHHVRFWKTTLRMSNGRSIYVGTASFDKSVKWNLIRHTIDPGIDTEREYLYADIVASGHVESSRKVELVSPLTGVNAAGDPFSTDGMAYVLWLK